MYESKNFSEEENKRFEMAQKSLKLLVDIYQIEYSQDLPLLFEQFSLILAARCLCGLKQPHKQFHWISPEWVDRNQHYVNIKDYYELSDEKLMDFIKINIEQFEDLIERVDNPLLHSLENIEVTIKNSAVLRRVLEFTDGLITIANSENDVNIIPRIVLEMRNLCFYNARSKNYQLTPTHIADFLVRLINMSFDQQNLFERTIFDPVCGAGIFLTSAEKHLQGSTFIGVEVNEGLRLSAVFMCLFLNMKANISNTNIIYDSRDYGSFDIVLANPPFISMNEKISSGDFAHIKLPNELYDIDQKYLVMLIKIVKSVSQHGQAAIVVPDGFLFASTRAAQQVRRWLVENYLLECVISLPNFSFYPLTGVNASVLIISNKPMSKHRHATDHIFFYNAESDGYEKGNKSKPIKDNDLDNLLDIWNRRDSYYHEWLELLQAPTKNLSGIGTPSYWEHDKFWFGQLEDLKELNYDLLPKSYQPIKQLSITVESPEELMEELIVLQEEILNDMVQLLKEAD